MTEKTKANRENVAIAQKAAHAIAKVIDHSNKEVFIVSGCLSSEVYEDAELTKAITDALVRGVAFEVIVGPRPDKESKTILDETKIHVYEATKWPPLHFVVGDSRNIRVEVEHKQEANLPAVENLLLLDIPEGAKPLIELFDEMKQSCTLYQRDQLALPVSDSG